MLKKIIIPATLCLGIYLAPASFATVSPENTVVETVLPDGQTAVSEAIDDNSEETNTIEESELTHKMLQAQKSEAAKTYDKYGIGLTLVAMGIVLLALIVLSILFYCFGSFSSKLLTKRKKAAKAKTATADSEDHEDHSLDSGETIAAIVAALSQHFSTDHDFEDTILTIRRMKKSYSPWNSKIYNMRHTPEHVHNPATAKGPRR